MEPYIGGADARKFDGDMMSNFGPGASFKISTKTRQNIPFLGESGDKKTLTTPEKIDIDIFRIILRKYLG